MDIVPGSWDRLPRAPIDTSSAKRFSLSHRMGEGRGEGGLGNSGVQSNRSRSRHFQDRGGAELAGEYGDLNSDPAGWVWSGFLTRFPYHAQVKEPNFAGSWDNSHA
jgi:hypothetical protein